VKYATSQNSNYHITWKHAKIYMPINKANKKHNLLLVIRHNCLFIMKKKLYM